MNAPRLKHVGPACFATGLVVGALAMLVAGSVSAAVETASALEGNLFVHDPSTIVRCGGGYWLFATGQGIVSRYSKDRVTWTAGPRVFASPPSWTTRVVPEFRGYFWAPDIIQTGGRYLLYYSVSAWGKRTSAIGLATNPTLDPADPKFHWTDHGIVVQSTAKDDFNAIDPSAFQDADGSLWMAFGSFWSGIKLVQLNPSTGLRLATNSPMHALAHHDTIEAPCLWRHGGHYFLFVNWGLCCRGTDSTYQIRVGRSASVTGPYLDRNGVDLLRDGGSPFLETSGALIGPGHAGIFSEGDADWLSCHYYGPGHGGKGTLALFRLEWFADGWPVVKQPHAGH